MEKKTIHISPDMTPRRNPSNGRRPSGQSGRQPQTRPSAKSGHPSAGQNRPRSGGSPQRRPMTEAERRRRMAIRKKRRRQRMIRRLVLLLVIALLILLAVVVLGKIFSKGKSETKEPEFVEVQDFIGLRDATGDAVPIQSFGTYGSWLRLIGTLTPENGQQVTALTLELHEGYETKMVPREEIYPEEVVEEEEPGFFEKLFTGKEEEASEKESESETEETFPPDPNGKASYPVVFTADELGNVTFTTSEEINSGISMEALPDGVYTVLLHAVYADGTEARYTLSDRSQMMPVDYWTITRDGVNKEVKLQFGQDPTSMQPFMEMRKEQGILPAEVYDFAIDAGHGGKDPGASNSNMTEAELTLQYATAIAQKLTAMGYKVLLTRDGTEDPNEDMAYTMYDPDGRVNKACASHAKLCLSIHFNSNKEVTKGGFEIYCSGRGDTELAGLIADTVVQESGAVYSNQKSYKVRDGVYVKMYTQEQIDSSNQKAARNNFAPYNLTLDTDYLYMIREPGSIWTNAYIDGRNPYFGANLYKDSNMGVEALLAEVAFMSVSSDIQNAIGNADAYEQGFADAINAWVQTLPTKNGTSTITEPAAEEAAGDLGDGGINLDAVQDAGVVDAQDLGEQ